MITNEPRSELKTIDLPSQHGPVPPRPVKSKKRGLIWVIFLLFIIGVTGYAVWRASVPATAVRGPGGKGGFKKGGGGGGRFAGLGPVPVVLSKVARSSIPVYLNGLGNVTAYYTVVVKSRVDGQLMKVNFNEGDFVKEGQILLEIDPRPFQVQLEMAQGTLARDQALLDNAKVDLERYKQLLATNAIPKQQLDTQVALVAQYEGTIKQDLANIDNAKLQLTYSKITAPITGVLGLRLVDPGNIVHASDTNGMVVITQLQPIAVLFTIPEDSLPQVTQKLRAGAHLPADAYNRDNSKKLASGTLMTLDNQIDNTTGTSKLKAVFDNKDNALFPQQFVNIRLLVDTLSNQLVVPNVAIQNGQQGTFVYVVDERFQGALASCEGGNNHRHPIRHSERPLGWRAGGSGWHRPAGGRRFGESAETRRARHARRTSDPGGGNGPDGGNGSGGGFKKGDGAFKKGDGGFKKGGGNFKGQGGGGPQ